VRTHFVCDHNDFISVGQGGVGGGIHVVKIECAVDQVVISAAGTLATLLLLLGMLLTKFVMSIS
jgi:hypothetical protein